MSVTASILALEPMLDYARARNVDVDEFLREIDVPLAMIDDYDFRIAEATRDFAWTEIPRRAGDEHFGIHAAEVAIEPDDVLGWAMHFSSTLGDALDRLFRFHRVLCDAWRFQKIVQGKVVRLRRLYATSRHEAENAVALLVVRARSRSGRRIVPHEVRFRHDAPKNRSVYTPLFGRNVRFGCSANEIVFRTSDLGRPISSANPGVNRVLDRYMTEILARLPKDSSFLEEARVHVASALPAGRPTIVALASKLRASPRTLQRRFAQYGTTHQEMVEAVRRDLAEKLLRDGQRSITEIAFLLGFEDVSSFRRAYKRWNGVAPSRARK